jgi:hypothetical protein
MPRKPSATSSSGSSSEVLAGPSATISTCSPLSATSCARSSMSIRPASSSSSSTPSRRTRVQDQTSGSGDPFRHARLSTSVAWKPRAASKGTSCLRGSSGPAASPASLAPSTTATSVPRLLPDDEPGEGLAKAAHRRMSPSALARFSGSPLDPVGPTTTCSRSLFSVSVPVLSTQAISTRPKGSTADSRRTSALREASRRATAASPRLERSGRPSGTAAMAVPAPSASWAARGRRQSRPPRMTSAPPPTTTGEHFQQHAVKAPLEHARVLGCAPKGGCSDTKARVAADRERHRRARPDGHVGAVEHYASLDRSFSARFATGKDSPVREA